MNEQIKELSKQAWEYAERNTQDGDGRHGGLYRDKFAELIVRECIQVAVKADNDDREYAWYAIQKHFGVDK